MRSEVVLYLLILSTKSYAAEKAAEAYTALEELKYDDSSDLENNLLKVQGLLNNFQSALVEYVGTFNFLMGDVNADDDVNVFDFTHLAKAIADGTVPTVSEDSTREEKTLFNRYDVNRDRTINVADLPAVVTGILKLANPNYTGGAKGSRKAPGSIAATVSGDNVLIALNNNISVCALQMDITAPGATVISKQIFADRADAHSIMVGNLGNDTYRVLIVGMQNKAFYGNSGNIAALSLNGLSGEVTVSNVVAADANAVSHTLTVSNNVTGINTVQSADAAGAQVFTVSGAQASGAQRGVNIMRAADGKVTKVVMK